MARVRLSQNDLVGHAACPFRLPPPPISVLDYAIMMIYTTYRLSTS